jgi:hypothetical protein
VKTEDLIVEENGSMTNMAQFSVGPCKDHGPTCERIVKMETQMTGVQEKVGNIDRKQDRFFWALLCGLAGIVLTLLVTLVNMTLLQKLHQ